VCPVHIPAGTVLPGGFVVEDHEMTIYGLCSECSGGPATSAASSHAHSCGHTHG
jgi:Fur family ferric uptake transcriptional regulator